MPTMYPPREIDGCIVCGGPDAVDGEYRSIADGYTYPAALETDLESRFDYHVHPDPLLSSNEERGAEVEEILDLFDKRFEVADNDCRRARSRFRPHDAVLSQRVAAFLLERRTDQTSMGTWSTSGSERSLATMTPTSY